MALKTDQNYQNIKAFMTAHPLAYPDGQPPNPVPPGAFPVGASFFTAKTVAELQALIDTTYKMDKALDYTAGNAAAAKAARTFIQQANSTSPMTFTVRWGLHQHDDRPSGDAGKAEHFTIALAAPAADWHLYVSTDGSRISFMSQSGVPADLVSIKKY